MAPCLGHSGNPGGRPRDEERIAELASDRSLSDKGVAL